MNGGTFVSPSSDFESDRCQDRVDLFGEIASLRSSWVTFSRFFTSLSHLGREVAAATRQ
jgi:hypothetical protein